MVKKRSRLFVLLLLPFFGAMFLAGFILYVVGDKKRATHHAQKTQVTSEALLTLRLRRYLHTPKPRKKKEKKIK
jgi:hypothetical protein